jgi:hypothetical protein
MREGLIVLPHAVADGHHKSLQDKLIDAFGGFTLVDAEGAWKDPHTKIVHIEPVAQYIIAYEPNDKQNLELLKIAEWLLSVTSELAVYMRYADGSVAIVDRQKAA